MSNSFGRYFKVTTFGESHGKYIGCIVDGCPSNISLNETNIQNFLDRRRPGKSALTSSRNELDKCEIVSGVFQEKTIGSPICILVKNTDQRSHDYQELNSIYRPNHADYTYARKYNLTNMLPGGGRASARETIGRVAAGAVAKTFVQSILPLVQIDCHINRVQDATNENDMHTTILKAKNAGDSVGGTIFTSVQNLPAGLGEPVFDKFEANLAKAMLSIPAAKFFESGDGLDSTYKLGSENNDIFAVNEKGKIYTNTNHSGGIQGGISNGMPITFTVGFKPVSTIFKKQNTVSVDGQNVEFSPSTGRHDPCVLPRAIVIVEAMTWLVIADKLKAHLSLGIKNLMDIQDI